jgi:hypothetical protein
MSLSHHEIVQQVETQLTAHPNATLQIIAQRLGIAEQLISDALREAEGFSFQEYQDRRRLEQAFRQLGEFSIAANGPLERRAKRRIFIPKATAKYRMQSFWSRSASYSNSCPLVDFSSDGIALLADETAPLQKRIALALKFPGEEETLQVEGCVVYSVATGIAGYRYRIGIQFLPFGRQKGGNTVEALESLTRIENAWARQSTGNTTR